jgi:hypothetical protein
MRTALAQRDIGAVYRILVEEVVPALVDFQAAAVLVALAYGAPSRTISSINDEPARRGPPASEPPGTTVSTGRTFPTGVGGSGRSFRVRAGSVAGPSAFWQPSGPNSHPASGVTLTDCLQSVHL